MSGYTHCRGCGRKVTRATDMADGLCSERGEPSEPEDNCYVKFIHQIPERAFGRVTGTAMNSVERAVAIDEWLESRR